jgi:hypothetical protein
MTITEYDLADLDDSYPETVGTCTDDDCDRKLVTGGIWDKAGKAQRRLWQNAGYYRNESAGQCRLHMERRSPEEHNAARKAEAEKRAQKVAGMYRGLVREGFRDPIGEIAFMLQMDIGSIQRFLRRAGQAYERRDERVFRRQAIIEEVQFFHSMGRGIREISDKLGITEEELSRNLRHWKTEGYVDYDLTWLDTHDIMVYRNGYTAA